MRYLYFTIKNPKDSFEGVERTGNVSPRWRSTCDWGVRESHAKDYKGPHFSFLYGIPHRLVPIILVSVFGLGTSREEKSI